ncbi:MAG: hypothetical protein KF830_10780 [Planctomycetes bacterium]|nr:hypothetical protein [Planctomycetota bacterium]
MRCLLSAALLLPIALRAQDATTSGASVQGRLREVRIAAADIFDADTAAKRPLAALVNGLHWQTREDVVRIEMWFRPGDFVDERLAAEFERNLRALGLFATVNVRLVPAPVAGEVDMEVETRDRLTLSFGGGGSYVGGVTGYGFALGESNLFGLGDRINASFRGNSEDEWRGGVAYTDLHVFDSWHTATLRLGRSDDGDSFGFELLRPFKHLADPRSHGGTLAYDETEVDYFRAGETAAEVPVDRAAIDGFLRWGTGPVHDRRFLGLSLGYERLDYGLATGPLGPSLRVPGDTRNLRVGLTGSWQLVSAFRKVEGIDTLGFVQDLRLGLDASATIGVRWRDEVGVGDALQPEFRLRLGWAAEPLPDLFTDVDARTTLRLDGGAAVGWTAALGARAFAAVAELHTLCANVAYEAVDEQQDLPLELTLGEDNGLRGYPAREFVGTRRLRTNLEHRFDTDVQILTLHFGLVAFFDAGWVGFGNDLDGPYRSVGVGLRVGSVPLAGGTVLRIDLAKPLDDVPGESDGWSLSVSVGQVFGFGG